MSNATFTRRDGEWMIRAAEDTITRALETGNPVVASTRGGDYVAVLLDYRVDDTTATIEDQWTLRYPRAALRAQDVLDDDDYVRIEDGYRGARRWLHRDDDGWTITYR